MGVIDDRLTASSVDERFVRMKTDYFVDVHLWPGRQDFNPIGWLSNFTPDEKPYAIHALNAFIYYSDTLADSLMRHGVQTLSSGICAMARSLGEAKTAWREFLRTTVFSYVHGESPRATDSGRVFARKVRQVLEIADSQIVDPQDSVTRLGDRSDGTLLLVDDFVGSGRQAEATWNRHYRADGGRKLSIKDLHANGVRVIYVPLVATQYGLDALKASCPGLEVRPVHVFDSRYSLTHVDSILWPPHLKERARDVLFLASDRAGIVEHCKHGWEGFHELGLALAFSHGVPDATLPLFYWETEHWRPLVRRV